MFGVGMLFNTGNGMHVGIYRVGGMDGEWVGGRVGMNESRTIGHCTSVQTKEMLSHTSWHIHKVTKKIKSGGLMELECEPEWPKRSSTVQHGCLSTNMGGGIAPTGYGDNKEVA